jgi:outer membrane receptor protein involved in Fe transport
MLILARDPMGSSSVASRMLRRYLRSGVRRTAHQAINPSNGFHLHKRTLTERSCLVGRHIRGLRSVFLGIVTAGFPFLGVQAQESAVISGRVSDHETGRPVNGARVTALAAVTTTADDGRYQLTVAARATFVIRVVRIGYTPLEQELRISRDTTRLDFRIVRRATGLDEVVVTGSAGATEVRSVGHSIARITPADVPEPVASIDHLLTSRVPGVSVLPSTGMVGSGAKIRLRGSSSVALSNQPLVYVDGVRIRSDGYPKNSPQFGERSRGTNDTPSPLNDIDPSDIERVEIVRGPAATTLYGTEAATGVIQIFTRRGVDGPTVWNSQLTTGVSYVRPFGPSNEPYMRLDPWLRDAIGVGYSLSAAGGSDLRYYLSGSYARNEGVLPKDLEKRVTLRANFDVAPMKKWKLALNTSVTNNDLSNTSAGPNAQGLTQNVYRGPSNATGVFTKESLDRILEWNLNTGIDHTIAGVTAVFTPDRSTSHSITLGHDRAASEIRSLRPYGFVFAAQGILSTERWVSATTTADYLGKFRARSGSLQGTIAWGGQAITTDVSSVSGYGEGFPGPSNPTISSAALTLASESRLRSVVTGVFSEATASWQDRLYLTAGLRVDGSSSFGSDLGLQPFPRASASWIVSEHGFWPERMGIVKLRAAYGEAGRAPGVFDAARTWSPVSHDGKPAYLPLAVGNPQLGPERSTETEIGFDAESRSGDARASVTFYRRTTRDALLPVAPPPSLGFIDPQLRNVGTFRTTGAEIALGNTWRLGRASFAAGLDVSLNKTRALDLGGTADFILDVVAWISEGRPAPVLIGPLLLNPGEIAEPVVEENHVFGPNLPTRTIGGNASIEIKGMTISGRAEYQGGSFLVNNASRSLYGQGVHPSCESAYAQLADGNRELLTAWERFWCVAATVRRDGGIVPGDFLRLRDLSVSVPLRPSLLKSRRASLTLTARNYLLYKSSEIEAFEPDMGGRDGMFSPVRAIELTVPTPASISFAVRATYW